jgi:hypothetical protein
VVPAPAHRARREQARDELGSAEGTPAPKVDKARTREGAAIYGHDRAGRRVDVGDVVLFTPVFVGPPEGAPPRGEREPAIAAGQIALISHGNDDGRSVRASVSAL